MLPNASEDLLRPSRVQHTIVMDESSMERMIGALMGTIERLGEKVDQLGDKVDRLDGSVQELKDTQPAALAAAIGSVMTNPDVISRVMAEVGNVAQDRAAKAAGHGVWWLLKSVVSKWLIVGAIVLLAAKAVGWDAAKAILRILNATT